jgi:hypothetical protein
VKYEGTTPNPAILANYIKTKEIMDKPTCAGDMLINNKTNEVIILAEYSGSDLFFINITKNKFDCNRSCTRTGLTRQQTVNNYIKSTDWMYIPIEQINATNFDIEMK